MESDEERGPVEPTEVPLLDAPIAAIRKTVRAARPKPARQAAEHLPYAQVVLNIELSHLDHTFDYLVPAELDEEAQPGVRVRCRFAGQIVDGFVIGRAAESQFSGRFEWLQKVVSPVPVLTPEVLDLARTVADRYAGTLADVLRLAIPPRHASAEKAPGPLDPGPGRPVDGAPWGAYGGGREFISALERKTGPKLPRALWTCLPGTDWAVAIATAMHAVASDARVLPTVPRPEPERLVQTSAAPVGDMDPDADFQPEPDYDIPVDVPADLDLGPDPDVPADFDPVRDLDNAAPFDADHDAAAPADSDGESASDRRGDPETVAAEARATEVRATVPDVISGSTGRPLPGSSTEPVHVVGRGALAIVPDHRDLARLDRALTEIAGPGRHVVLSEELGPAKRYQNWLAVLRGEVRMVIGTRSAMFAPVADLGLVAIWDDGDDLHAEPRAPYPHVREVLLLRAHTTGAAALVGGYACTAEGAQLVETRWAYPLTAFRSTVRAKSPLMRTVTEFEQERDPIAVAARLPTLAWRTAREALAYGPVLVQVPRGGYAPALACIRCRKAARCMHCHGPLELSSGHAMASCGWCGRPAGGWRCDGFINDRPCGGDRFRMMAVGVQRTAEELGRAFSNTKVISSAQDTVIAEVGPKSALVVATPGAEPVADGGYAAALLLDGWSLLGRRDLRAGEEALRRWLNAAALVRPGNEGGTVVVMAEPSLAPVQALVRWDPVWHARRELADRAELHYPPVARVAELTGTPAAVAEELKLLRLPEMAEVLGPVGVGAPGSEKAEETLRALVRVPRRFGAELAAAIREAQGVRSAHKAEDWVRVRMDPMQIG